MILKVENGIGAEMGNYHGKEELVNALKRMNLDNYTSRRGLAAEIEVGNKLEEYLPEDTYIIAHPQIGNYDPDFLVISPRYGFRIIEVKNWNPKEIKNAESNGTITVHGNKTANPMAQVKKHRDELWEYLKTNHNISDPAVDCLVIHYGFTKAEFKDKYDKNWSPEFYKNTLFKDQLDHSIDERLKHSAKALNRGIGKLSIQSITNSIKISDNYDEKDKEIQVLMDKLESAQNELKDKDGTIGYFAGEQRSVKKFGYAIITLLVILIIGMFIVFSIQQPKNVMVDKNPEFSIVEVTKDKANIGNYFTALLLVKEFNYDKKSGTKFIIFSDGESTIKGVIFKDTKGIPYIEENNSYIVDGILSVYNNEYQLEVNKIRDKDGESYHETT